MAVLQGKWGVAHKYKQQHLDSGVCYLGGTERVNSYARGLQTQKTVYKRGRYMKVQDRGGGGTVYRKICVFVNWRGC